LESGFRSIDTATDYGNEAEVGEGIKDSNVPRSEIFLTTKLKNCDHRDIEGALNRSLARLKTDYLDLCVSPSVLCNFAETDFIYFGRVVALACPHECRLHTS